MSKPKAYLLRVKIPENTGKILMQYPPAKNDYLNKSKILEIQPMQFHNGFYAIDRIGQSKMLFLNAPLNVVLRCFPTGLRLSLFPLPPHSALSLFAQK
jgi:hypothetical protein